MSYNKKLFLSLSNIETKYNSLTKELESLTNDFKKMAEINKTLKDHSKVMEKFQEYKAVVHTIDNVDNLLKEEKDHEMIELIKTDFEEAKSKVESLEEELQILLLPKDVDDEKDVIFEMRPAAGGSEASIFVGNMYEAYMRYAQSQNWKVEVIESAMDTYGYSFISFSISGSEVYSKMKFESGVHRVQRVPLTESKGRVHTSTITVAVLPEVDDVEVEIKKSDLREDLYCASGAGGQHVNKTQSAVRITHIPTGIVVACQEGKSQHSNRDTAMKLLRSKLYEKMKQDQHDELAGLRKNQVGSGERSEKIRTYNYPQNRVTDHRIGLSLNKLDIIMQGDFKEIIDALIADDQTKKMSNLEF
ncbi:MAG: peptide chain release factor 1 [Mycoplasmoidaceae bacterium]